MKKTILLITALLLGQAPQNFAQPRFVGEANQPFFEWFNLHSQTAQRYEDQTKLYIFNEQTAVRQLPSVQSSVLHTLTAGTTVENIAYGEDYLPTDQRNGYFDIWYHVKVADSCGKMIDGYVWGGDIAKSWRQADVNLDGKKELVMLGISTKKRSTTRDFAAELRILQNDHFLEVVQLDGLCVFEECGSNSMLRVYRSTQLNGQLVIETGTMTIGCDVGVERSLHVWDGQQLQAAYYGEITTNKTFLQKTFSVQGNQYRFSHWNNNYEPVWKTLNKKGEEQPIARA